MVEKFKITHKYASGEFEVVYKSMPEVSEFNELYENISKSFFLGGEHETGS